MAVLTLLPQAARVDVIPGVARSADHRWLHEVLRLQMTLRAADFCVRTQQRKAGSRGVVELPDLPAVGCVTGGAVLAQRALVSIVLCVTAIAVLRGFLELLGQVTLPAGHHHVQPQQREAGQVVIERDIVPADLRVALLALLAERASVGLVGSMARGAIGGELLSFGHAGVARVAVETRVRRLQGKFEARQVIEMAHAPGVVGVAVGTLWAEPARMAVVGLVTAGAVLGDRVLQVAAAVAILTADVSMTAEEGETCLARVIELLRGPVRRRVAVAALGSLTATVHVVGHVATHALLGRALVVLAGMAGRARDGAMLVSERKVGLVVVETRLPPRLGAVTGHAVRPQPPAVRVIFFVTADAGR